MTQRLYLLDTNIAIYLRRQRPKAVVTRFSRLLDGEAAMSVVSYGELQFGVRNHPQPDDAAIALQELTSLVPVLPLPEGAGRFYGEIQFALRKRGELIGNNDMWIAAHALSADLIVVTNNEREFRRVNGLRIENWTLD